MAALGLEGSLVRVLAPVEYVHRSPSVRLRPIGMIGHQAGKCYRALVRQRVAMCNLAGH